MWYGFLAVLSFACRANATYVRTDRSEVSIEPMGDVHGTIHGNKHEEVMNLLWDGTDLPEYTQYPQQKTILIEDELKASSRKASTRKTLYGLHGAFDTGTNLFAQTVALNFPTVKQNFNVWKHSTMGAEAITKAWENKIAPLPLNQLVIVAMVRTPMSQVVAWKKKPYNLWGCVRKRHYVDMVNPCTATTENTVGYDQNNFGEHNFSSIMDVYNTYMKQWQDMRSSGKFKDVMIVNYEDLILDPQSVMMKFGHIMDAQMAGQSIKLVEESAKQWETETSTHDGALVKLRERAWLGELGQAGLQALCPLLNKQLIQNFVEGTYRAQHVPYGQDCEAFMPR
mmetsp:Transcript_16348/g.28663  ORF Transcript_16348/g.28663 Transcript_16348/m.28663 type:complete len:339 (+) Transcript_16348:66-1082(+)